MLENRDISAVTAGRKRPAVRPRKVCDHNFGVHAAEKSDIGINERKTLCHLDKKTVKGWFIKIAGRKVAVHLTPAQKAQQSRKELN
ncbi:MAG: hypothetical protein Q7J85_10680, partial [Bacillota bacterium]|nr:hypothetical protein [Bacillota bacterium]